MQDVLRPRGPAPTKGPATAATKLMGRFHCEALLGSEGLLETWRARVQGLAGFDRVFAVKCLVPGALTRRQRSAEDLLRSARAVAALKDDRIATVMDSGLAPGSAFVATELVHGISLRALREYVHGRAQEQGGRPGSWPAVILHVSAEIAAALRAAHGSDPPLTHGALAAGSVMVTPQGGIKLVDLGLFASVHTPAEIASSPVRRPCAAPELSRGQAPGPASDMYALGALALELATGRERRASGKLESGTSWSRVLAAELQTLIRRLLSFDIAERPSAESAEAALREAMTLVRGLDLRGELGLLVRRVMQDSGTESILPVQADAEPDDGEEIAAIEPGDQPFVDEPTQVLTVSEDGSPDKLAGILRDMREAVEAEEGTVIDGPRTDSAALRPTPRNGSIPIPPEATPPIPSADYPVDLDSGSMDAAAATQVQTVSPVALAGATPIPPLAPPPPAPAPPPPPLKLVRRTEVGPRAAFAQFAPEVGAPAQMTPSGWQPAGNLEDPTETDLRPLTDEPADANGPAAGRSGPGQRRRLGRVSRAILVVLAAAAFGAGLAAAVRFVASKPPAAVSH
jgi:serine/threonine protein kinase